MGIELWGRWVGREREETLRLAGHPLGLLGAAGAGVSATPPPPPPVAPSGRPCDSTGVHVTLQTGRRGSDRSPACGQLLGDLCFPAQGLFLFSHLHPICMCLFYFRGRHACCLVFTGGGGWGCGRHPRRRVRGQHGTPRSGLGLSSLSSQPPHLHAARWAPTSLYFADCSRSVSTNSQRVLAFICSVLGMGCKCAEGMIPKLETGP